jgi:hypothetical protein
MACKPPGCRQPRRSLQSASPGPGQHVSAGRRAPGGSRTASVSGTRRGSLRALSASPTNIGQPEGMPWALLVLSWVLHQTPRYGDRCSPACRMAPAATSGGLRLPRTTTFCHTSTPARSGQSAAAQRGTGWLMGRPSHENCRAASGTGGPGAASRRSARAHPAVWVFREPPSLTVAADDGLRVQALAACEKARGWHRHKHKHKHKH